jgi:peptidoglycan/LPS O-acetylase OafA/YrhL
MAEGGAGGRLGYRPALDGLRAVAITLVVCLHSWTTPKGGELGVDLFFVLSGFLITRLLMEEHRATGTFSLRSFYKRRVRRLMPALLVMLTVSNLVALASGNDRLLFPTLAGLTYTTNLLAATHHYTGSGGLEHLWSLAEEEQFYLLWPSVLIVLLRFRRRIVITVLLVVFAAAVAHECWLVLHGADGARLGNGPDTRADGLIAGCLLAVSWEFVSSRVAGALVVALAPLAYVAIVDVPVGTPQLNLGLLAAVAVFFAAIVRLAIDPGPLAWMLGLPPFRFLGRISYSLYLWHPPIFAAFGVATAAVDVKLGAIALSLLVAAASYRLIEQPFRHRSRRPAAALTPA